MEVALWKGLELGTRTPFGSEAGFACMAAAATVAYRIEQRVLGKSCLDRTRSLDLKKNHLQFVEFVFFFIRFAFFPLSFIVFTRVNTLLV